MANDTAKRRKGREHRTDDKSWIGQLLQRRLRNDPIEQRRQRHIKDEEVHPGESGVRNRLEFPTAKPEEDQTKKRQRQVDDFEHAAAYRLPLRWSIFLPLPAKAAWPSSGVPRTVGESDRRAWNRKLGPT
jgi:hypothetical protein